MRDIPDNNTRTGGSGIDAQDIPAEVEPSETSQINVGRTCKKMFCTETPPMFQDYCRQHGPPNFDDDPFDGGPAITPTPSDRDLEAEISRLAEQIEDLRQENDRLEAKIDALLMALDVEVDDDE